MVTKCRSCGAQIEWAQHRSTGARIPLDAYSVADGNLVVIEQVGPVAIVEHYDAPRHHERMRRRSHFATCPQAAKWRRT